MGKISTGREQQYRAIIAKEGKRFEDYRVVAFTFKEKGGPERFHFRLLMTVPGPEYVLFDCFGLIAQVIVPNDERTVKLVQELAGQVGGEKTTPNLR